MDSEIIKLSRENALKYSIRTIWKVEKKRDSQV